MSRTVLMVAITHRGHCAFRLKHSAEYLCVPTQNTPRDVGDALHETQALFQLIFSKEIATKFDADLT